MKAILLRQPGHFEQIDIDPPASPGRGQALVRVQRVGICGTCVWRHSPVPEASR